MYIIHSFTKKAGATLFCICILKQYKMNLLIVQEKFDELYAKLESWFQHVDQKAESFLETLIHSMEIVEQWARTLGKNIVIHGMQKKEIVMAMMAKIGDKLVEEKDLFFSHVNTIMDKMIDILVEAAKGNLHFNEVKERCAALCVPKPQPKIAVKDVADVEALAKQMHDNIKQSIVDKKFNMTNVVTLVTLVMQMLEQIPALSGPEKKAVAISVIKSLVAEIPIPGVDPATISAIVETSLSKMIDFIISAANGEFDFSKIVEQWKSCFPCCYKK